MSIRYMGEIIANKSAGVATGILTEEEYENLSAHEKNTGLYFIPDTNDLLEGQANVYSTEETIVGRWIDGRPLYRKVVVGKMLGRGSMTSIQENEVLIEDVNEITKLYGVINAPDSGWIPVPQSIDGGGSYAVMRYNKIEAGTKGLLARTDMPTLYDAPIKVIFEYTKTTDNPIASLTNNSAASISTQSDEQAIFDEETMQDVQSELQNGDDTPTFEEEETEV